VDIKELNKTQLILLSLLITFVVSIATGIVTVSLMNQMPDEVPQTINNVIQRTIEKVTTVQVPAPVQKVTDNKKDVTFIGDGDVLISIYPVGEAVVVPPSDIPNDPNLVENNPPIENTTATENTPESPKTLGQGIIISDVGLILVESSILNGYEKYKVILNKTDFEVSVLKKFGNGFSVLKIVTKQDTQKTEIKKETTPPTTP
jgi:hypothetical protein